MHTPYDIRVSTRARAMRVAVHPGGDVVVTVPSRTSPRSIERFLERYASWIERAQARSSRARVVHAQRRLIATYKKDAQSFAEKWCVYYAARYGVSYRTITIRSQKTRWGSCSRAGNLSFNYKIALLPEDLMRYIIVHEICHLRQFDHSRAFWELVARSVPEHRTLRAQLRGIVVRFS